ncbi:MCP four helix bundle domain-containing protein, partial [Pantoea ananatis]|uniref:MCP four helix bundle domain-containing protein n=1 Tax=Pantoea ananas TaxID=553 RepID=UPI0024AD7926
MVFFQKTKLSHRLIIMAVFFLFFILLVSVISVFFMKKTANDEWNTYESRLVPVQVLNDAAIEMGQHFRRAYSYIHPSGSVTEAESRQ